MKTAESLFGHRVEKFFVPAALLLLAVALSAGAAESGLEEDPDLLLDPLITLKHSSGKFVVSGGDRPEVLSFMNWVEELVGRLEKLSQCPFPFDGPEYFQVVLLEKVTPQGSGDSLPQVEVKSRIILGERIAMLVIHDYRNADRARVMEGLCRLMFKELIRARAGDVENVPSLPTWFVRGISQNLFVKDKGRNNCDVSRQWNEGHILTADSILRPVGDAADFAVCGVFVEWLLSFPLRTTIIEAIIERTQSGKTVTIEWLSHELADGKEGFDLEAQWDFWILREKQRIYQLGRLDDALIEQLGAELLIYKGSYGIPWSSNMSEVLAFDDLIELKDEGWVPALCRRKAGNIQMLGIGKERGFAEITRLYSDFLLALSQRKSDWRLRRMLKEADSKWKELVGLD